MVVASVGFMFSVMAVAALVRWMGLIYVAISGERNADGRIALKRGITLAVCQSLFHAGPWSVLVTLFVAYHIRTEPWAPWLFAGFVFGFVLMGGVSSRVILQFWKRRHEDPNAV
jgi:hypothetical protein